MEQEMAQRDASIVSSWVPEMTAIFEQLQVTMEKSSKYEGKHDFLFDYLNQMRLGVVRLRGAAGSESARFTVLIAGQGIPGPEGLRGIYPMRARTDAAWGELTRQMATLDSPSMELVRQTIETKLNGDMRKAQERVLAAWQAGTPSPITVDEYAQLSLAGLGSLEGLIAEISASARYHADEKTDGARQEFAEALLFSLLTLGLILVVTRMVARRIILPLESLAAAAKAVAEGRMDVRVQQDGVHEVRAVGEQFNRMVDAQVATLEQARTINAKLEIAVQARTAELQRANKDLESFSYSVAHDLRAPVRHMSGYSSLLRENLGSKLEAEDKFNLDKIDNAAIRMGRLIDDLLEYARVGRLPISKTSINLNELVEEAIVELQPAIGDRKIEWHLSALPTVVADLSLWRQVVLNLLSNAIKYTRKSPAARIDVASLAELDGELGTGFWIRDNGVGFRISQPATLFQPFKRFHAQSEFEGTGVGLSIVHRIVERHGGKVWLESQEGVGTTVFCQLPN